MIDKDGRRPDLERAAAIKDMPAPDNIVSLQSFLGLANYYQVFIQNMHDLRTLLNELLKKDKTWDWTAECQETFEKIKKTLTSELFLTLYNPDLKIIVTSNASSYGVGACILYKMTDGILKPIAHALRALFPAEKNLFANQKKGSWDYIRSLKVPPLYLRSTLPSTNRPQATIHHFGLKKGSSYAYSQ